MDVQIGDEDTAALYWMLEDPVYSLVEIGVQPGTGRMLGLEVVLYKDEIHLLRTGQQAAEEDRVGVPCFSRDLWDLSGEPGDFRKYYHKVPGRCRLESGVDQLRIQLFAEEIAYRVMVPHQFACEFSKDGYLCGILLLDLRPTESEMFREYHRLRKETRRRLPGTGTAALC
jgi:hypothetical protein